MKIEIFEITSKEDKIYLELLNQYKTNVKLQKLLNKSHDPSPRILARDFSPIALLDRFIGIDII